MTGDGKKPLGVLVTGASTGIGHACTTHLASKGFVVYAGARKQGDLDALASIDNVVPVTLDVTNSSHVQAIVDKIEQDGGGLFGLVNNAGIGVGGPLADVTDEELQRQFDVNLFGVHRVTRACLPFILAARGRIVMMSSVNGRIAMPFLGPYSSSKFALEGYADALRRELLPYGVRVAVVEPGLIKTPIWDKAMTMLEDYKKKEPLIEDLARFGINHMPGMVEGGKNDGKNPVDVAKAVHAALTATKPKPRYVVSKTAWQVSLGTINNGGVVDAMVMRTYKKWQQEG